MLVNVRVIPKSSRNLVKEESGRLKVYCTAPPQNGRANGAVAELLAEHYHVKKHQVRIVKGALSAHKIVSIEK